jgi:hypothetical protein
MLQDGFIQVRTMCSSHAFSYLKCEGRFIHLFVGTAGGASKAQACTTVLHRTLLQDGFKVLETSGPAESIELLTHITK